MKRIFAALIALMMIFTFFACHSAEVEAPTAEPEVETTIPMLTYGTEIMLAAYTNEFNWHEDNADIILRYVPDVDMLVNIQNIDSNHYIITMSDDTIYRMSVHQESREILSITYDVEIATENDILYVK